MFTGCFQNSICSLFFTGPTAQIAGPTAHGRDHRSDRSIQRSDRPEDFDFADLSFSFGVSIEFNTSLPLYWYIDLHSFHSYWSDIRVEFNIREKVSVLLFTSPLVAFTVQQGLFLTWPFFF